MSNNTINCRTEDIEIENIPLLTRKQRKKRKKLKEKDAFNIETARIKWNGRFYLHDYIMTIINIFQLFSLTLAISLRWPWPETVLKQAWITVTNLDFWFIDLVYFSDAYKVLNEFTVDSSKTNFKYWLLMIVWACVLIALIIIYVCLYIKLRIGRHSSLKKWYVTIIQFINIPVCTYFGRLWHCSTTDNNSYKMDVLNEENCWTARHLLFYCVPSVAVFLLFNVVIPIYLCTRIHGVLHAASQRRYEETLQQIELEAAADIVPPPMHIYLIVCLKRSAQYYKPFCLFLHSLLAVLYAAGFENIYVQAVLITVLFFFFAAYLLISRPFRVTSFNVHLIISYIALGGYGIIGCLMAPGLTTSVWFTPNYLRAIVFSVFFIWLIITVIIIIYIIISLKMGRRLWPMMELNDDSLHFLKNVRLATACMNDAIRSREPLLVPVHELGRHIHIVNANLREAEFLGDPMKCTLWRTLDTLVHVHSKLAPKSLFNESIKKNIQQTTKEFLKVKNQFAKRLALRDIDLAFSTVLKKRLLLKMFCVACFVSMGKRTYYVSRSKDKDNSSKPSSRGSKVAVDVGDFDESIV